MKYKYIILFLAIFIITFSWANLKNISEPKEYVVDIDAFEEILHKKENFLQKVIDSLREDIIQNKYELANDNKNIFPKKDISYLSKQGLCILIYHNDTLKYWSNNSFKMNSFYDLKLENSRLINFKNSWSLIQNSFFQQFKIVGLIKIKDSYSYQNNLVVNNFAKDFDAHPSIKISAVPLSYSYPIKDKNQEYVFYLIPSNSKTENPDTFAINILYLTSLIFFFLFIVALISLWDNSNKSLYIIATILLISTLRFFMIYFKFPNNLYNLEIFDPSLYAKSFLFGSLGDLLINTFIFVIIPYAFIIILKNNLNKILTFNTHKYIKFLLLNIFITLIFLTAIYLNNLGYSLITDSNIYFEIYNVLSANIYSFIGISILTLFLGIFVYLATQLIFLLTDIYNTTSFFTAILFNTLIYATLYYVFNLGIYYNYLLTPLIIFAILFIHRKKHRFKYYSYIFSVLTASMYIVIFVMFTLSNKYKEETKLLINQLTNEHDILAELLLSEMETNLKNDETIIAYLQTPYQERVTEKLENYLQKAYFSGYWNKYYINILVFSNAKEMKSGYSLQDADNLYLNSLDSEAEQLENLNYYFLANNDGSISYIVKEYFESETNQDSVLLLLNLQSKILPKELGYPELLIDETLQTSNFQNYSYAKYKDNKLISKSGDYSYKLSYYNDSILNMPEEYIFLTEEDYIHLFYKTDNQNFIILTKARTKPLDFVIFYAYLFLFFSAILLIFSITKNFNIRNYKFYFNFKNKLLTSMISILLLSFILIGPITVYFNIIKFKSKQNQSIIEKIHSIAVQLEQQLLNYENTFYIYKDYQSNELDYSLKNISEVFFSDINIYNIYGELIATSRSELYTKDLIGTKINPTAFFMLVVNNEPEIIIKEKIANMEFSSAYFPLKNRYNKEVAYINIPFFINPDLMQQEIYNLLVTIINLYVILFILAIVITIFLAEKVVAPLRLIQQKFQKLELGKRHEIIDYKGNDEIGELIYEYNMMVKKLETNINLLAKSERENAWREMAKQVAHEIKNPLTPMKLKIQFLLKAWQNNDTNFDEKIQNFATTLIEQIDTLSRIATEFSSFAKIPTPNEELFDIVAKIETIVQLYENTENSDININTNNNKTVLILADKEQISRVFINLIKNAIQAIPDGVHGKVKVDLKTNYKNVIIKIEDNGTGISEEMKNKLFQPSFTTKRSGMGLGLAISKNIVNNANGEIWFESEEGKGSTFFVEFPIAHNNN